VVDGSLPLAVAAHRKDGRLSRRAAVEVIAIGDELLIGDTIDTNGAWLGSTLAESGIRVARRTVVGDQDDAIRSAVSDALARTSAAVCCGGLGPTPDDRTRPVVAAIYGWPLELDESWMTAMHARFDALGRDMPEANRVQAEVPRGAVLFRNAIGTAPGLGLADDAHGITVLLPGVPREMRWLMENAVVGWLQDRLDHTDRPIRRLILRTTGMAESSLAERIAGVEAEIAPLTLAYLPMGSGIDLRITSWGDVDEADVTTRFERAERLLRDRLGDVVYSTGWTDLADVVGHALRQRGLTISLAESCTGGLLAKRLTDSPGSSDFMVAGVVSYANAAKTSLLDVPTATIEQYGAVSRETVAAMLEGILHRTGTRCGISVTGVAGPGGGTDEKPVGTVWVAAAAGDGRRVRRLNLPGNRAEVRERATQAALKILLDMLTRA